MNDEYFKRLEDLRKDMDLFIDNLIKSYMWHLRIIVDKEIPFPKNYELVGYDSNIELTTVRWNEHKNKGWSKPDKQFLDVELRYLWKDFHPKTGKYKYYGA
jgi:hypothetical protein